MGKLTIIYAVSVFNFLLETNEQVSGKEYADKIRKAYSMDNPNNRAIVDLIESAVDWYQCINRVKGEFRLRVKDEYYNQIITN